MSPSQVTFKFGIYSIGTVPCTGRFKFFSGDLSLAFNLPLWKSLKNILDFVHRVPNVSVTSPYIFVKDILLPCNRSCNLSMLMSFL